MSPRRPCADGAYRNDASASPAQGAGAAGLRIVASYSQTPRIYPATPIKIREHRLIASRS